MEWHFWITKVDESEMEKRPSQGQVFIKKHIQL